MSAALELVGSALLVAGTAFVVVGGIGLLRLPDLFSRMHAGGVTDTAGAALLLGGLMLHAGIGLAALKLLAILFFLLVTSPTACHALAQAALSHGIDPLTGRESREPRR